MSFIANIKSQIVNPLIGFMVAIAFIYFLWGVVEMLMDPNNPKSVESGKKHMFWGVIGLFISVTAMGITSLIANTIASIT